MANNREFTGPYTVLEKVTKRHSKKCKFCDKLPEKMRIMVWSENTCQHWKWDCYCVNHGIRFIRGKIKSLQSILEELENEQKVKEDTFCSFLDLR